MNEIFSSGTQYADLIGNVTISGYVAPNLHAFAKDNGIDTDKYFPVGIDIYLGEHGVQSISVVAIEKEKNDKHSGYNNFKEYIESNNVVDVQKFYLPDATFEDYMKLCKGLSISATTIPGLMNKEIKYNELDTTNV